MLRNFLNFAVSSKDLLTFCTVLWFCSPFCLQDIFVCWVLSAYIYTSSVLLASNVFWVHCVYVLNYQIRITDLEKNLMCYVNTKYIGINKLTLMWALFYVYMIFKRCRVHKTQNFLHLLNRSWSRLHVQSLVTAPSLHKAE